MALVNDIRATLDKSKSQKLKSNLPSVCFSGKFGADRKDEQIIEHSGFIVLDFDDVYNLRDYKKAQKIYNFDLKNIMADFGAHVDTSKTNLLLSIYFFHFFFKCFLYKLSFFIKNK